MEDSGWIDTKGCSEYAFGRGSDIESIRTRKVSEIIKMVSRILWDRDTPFSYCGICLTKMENKQRHDDHTSTYKSTCKFTVNGIEIYIDATRVHTNSSFMCNSHEQACAEIHYVSDCTNEALAYIPNDCLTEIHSLIREMYDWNEGVLLQEKINKELTDKEEALRLHTCLEIFTEEANKIIGGA